MKARRMRIAPAGVAALLLLAPGCASVRDHKGFVPDMTLVATVQPGIDNRTSVERTLGRPSFVGEFDPNTWYYISRYTRARAFSTPHPTSQLLLVVKFDGKGNVASVDKQGLEHVVSVDTYGKTTPTLGSHHSFLGALFGNIGAVGQGGEKASTADNPN